MEAHRILSLDGGGVWAMLQIMALQKFFGPQAKGYEVLRSFNLAAASGGGSIVLAGLAMNMTLQEILDAFFINEANRQKLFGIPKTGYFNKAARLKRLEALKDILGKDHESTLGDLARVMMEKVQVGPQFLICAFDCDRRRLEFFRSANNSRSASSTGSSDPSLVDVIHASATSPINNPDALASINNTRFCDGAAAGLYNPVVAAITEALANRNAASSIQVLSIGTGTVERTLSDTKEAGGRERIEQADFLRGMTHAAFNDPPDTALYIAHVMLGQSLPAPGVPPPIVGGSVVRMSPAISPGGKRAKAKPVSHGGLDPSELNWLAAMDKGALAQRSVNAVKRLGVAWLDDKVGNQSIRADRNFQCEIGHDKASGAIAQWKALAGDVTRRAA